MRSVCSWFISGKSFLALLVPWMRIPRHLHAQRVDTRMRTAEQRFHIQPADGEVHRLFGSVLATYSGRLEVRVAESLTGQRNTVSGKTTMAVWSMARQW